ncbi:MAG: metalloregulator ArsR/SmtB family transcription factor [Pseudomonadota bacterium]
MTDTIACESNRSAQQSCPLSADQLARIFKALGHPTRIKIVEHLIAINTCVCGEIVGIFPFSQSTISQHLKQLKESGIVCGEVEGPKTWFCVDKRVLNDLKAYMEKL